MMEILEFGGGLIIVGFFLVFSYIGIHMTFEKDAKKRMPLLWEKGGLLNKTYRKVFDKNDVKYQDGDNT